MLVTQTKSYPCGSVPVWKTPSKPPGRSRGERSQGSPSRDCVVEARRRYSEGMHVGSDVVRVPAPAAKHVSRFPSGFLGRPIRLTFLATRVSSAFTWRKWHLIPTDEVSRHSRPPGGVKLAHKARRNGQLCRCGEGDPDRPHLGDGSRAVVAPPSGGVKRKTTERVARNLEHTGQLVTPVKAPKWPVWSSFRQPGPSSLRNILPSSWFGALGLTSLGKQHG
jgi:hypothetical protein